MRSIVEPEEQEQADSEVTLSTTSLLGIFFGLVVLCGVLFGLGYSMGRRASNGANAAVTTSSLTSAVPTTAVSPGGRGASDVPTIAKPSADGAVVRKPAAKDEFSGDESAASSTAVNQVSSSPGGTGEADPQVQAASRRQALPLATTVARAAPRPAQVAPLAPTAGGTASAAASMVQVAAVSRSGDADALIAALRKHGYEASARSEPRDSLIHVQIGPFTTRAEANAMRQKLLSDGYNAILK